MGQSIHTLSIVEITDPLAQVQQHQWDPISSNVLTVGECLKVALFGTLPSQATEIFVEISGNETIANNGTNPFGDFSAFSIPTVRPEVESAYSLAVGTVRTTGTESEPDKPWHFNISIYYGTSSQTQLDASERSLMFTVDPEMIVEPVDGEGSPYDQRSAG